MPGSGRSEVPANAKVKCYCNKTRVLFIGPFALAKIETKVKPQNENNMEIEQASKLLLILPNLK